MQEFLNIALSFPTIFWTGLVGLVTAYWLFVIIGALDIELLDLHLHLEPDVDLDVDVDVDVDAHVDGDVDAGGASPLGQLAVVLGIGKVPITILLTLFSFSGWFVSYFGMLYAAPMFKVGAIGAIIFGVAFAVAVPMMGVFAQPLKKVFKMTSKHGGAELIGQVCEISTGSVNGTFGQAKFDDGGAGLLLSVRCESDDNRLKRRSTALIIGYDHAANIYFVEPYEQFLPSDDDVELAHAAVHSEELVNAKREG